MGGKGLGQCARLFLFLRFQLFKEGHEGVGIVPGLVHILQPQIIGFSFVSAAELQEGERQADTDRLTDSVTQTATYKDQRNAEKVGKFGLGGAAGGMAGGYLGNFMGHHAGQFGFLIGRQDQS